MPQSVNNAVQDANQWRVLERREIGRTKRRENGGGMERLYIPLFRDHVHGSHFELRSERGPSVTE